MRRAVAPRRRQTRHRATWAVGALALVAVAATGGPQPDQAGDLLVDDPGLGPAAAVARWLWVAGVLLGGGVALARLALWRRALPPAIPARLTAVGLLAAALGALATGPLRAGVATGSWAAVSDPAVVERQLAGPLGAALALTAVGLAGVALSTRRSTWPWLATGALGGAVAAAAPLAGGHAVTMDPSWLGITAMGAHLLAAATWIGALAVLATVWWVARHDGRLAAQRGAIAADVSAVALAAVVVVALAGTALAIVQVERPAALATPYGATLVAKLALVAGVLAVAARNRRRVRLVDAPGPTAALGRGLRLELAGIVAILAISGALASLEPAGQAAAQPVTVQGEAAGREVVVVVDPAIAGTNEVHLYILDGGVPDADAADAEVTATGPGGQRAPAAPFVAGPGHWFDPAWAVPASGTWRVTVTFRVDDTRAETDLTVPISD